MNRPKQTIALIVALLASGCTNGGGDGANDAASDETAAAPTNRIEIPSTVRRNLGITFASVERRRVEDTIRVPGAFELQPLARHEYRMMLPGRVQILVAQYQTVEPGDVLFRFRSPAWPELQHEIILGEQAIETARADIEVAAARRVEAEKRLEIMRARLATLVDVNFKRADLEADAAAHEASLPRLRAEVRQAETALADALRTRDHAVRRAAAATGLAEDRIAGTVDHDGVPVPAYLTIDSIDVVADEPGVVEMLAATDGSFVEAPTIVLSTVDPSKVRFRAMALQADLVRLAKWSTARIVPPTTPGIDPGDGVEAELTFGLEAHPDQRTVTLLAAPKDARAWIRPGVSAFLEVVVESTGHPALAIPRAAIVKDGIVHVFFRRDPKDANKAIRVEADLGVSDGRWIEVLSGLAPNDEVVLNGAYELKLASQQSGLSQKGGHFHADGSFHGDH